MSKVSNSIKLLQILSSHRRYKISELAELLETKPRNIIEYKKELELAGYYIESIRGRHGGYFLEHKNLLPIINLNEVEFKAYNDGLDYLLSRNDFVNKSQFIKASSKIRSILHQDNNKNSVMIIDRFPLKMSVKDVQERYNAVNISIESKNVFKMKYISQKNIEKEYLIHPYKLFMYNNAWFVIAWSTSRNDVVYFKLNRIISFEILKNKFEVFRGYHESDFLDEYGMKNNGDWITIRLKVTNQYSSLIKERVYGRNQNIEEIDNHTSILYVEMQNVNAIKAFILGFGSNAKVLEPKFLIEDIKKELRLIEELYNT